MDRFGLFMLAVSTVITVAPSNLPDSEIFAFDVPTEIQEEFPYYLSGYDEEGAPIWIFEGGKWDMRKYVEQGGRQIFMSFSRFFYSAGFEPVRNLFLECWQTNGLRYDPGHLETRTTVKTIPMYQLPDISGGWEDQNFFN
ncbi:unnamed protein product [Allacma fusca]|uniref:Uncharacterized protein n=1 Tax=Allacma fusca TaxID=39272 RepID=A0A8J2LFZ2_9HEXA|nr:unnamed protein product [Allacma fusca]